MALVPYNGGGGGGVYTTRTSSFPGVYRSGRAPSARREYVERDTYGDGYDGGRGTYGRRGFPFMIVRVIGGILLLMALLTFIVGIVAVALNVPKEEKDPLLLTIGAVTMGAISVLAAVTGAIGILHSERRSNLEAYRNSFQTLCVLTAALSLILMSTAAYFHDQLYGGNVLVLPDELEANGAIYITLCVFLGITFLAAIIGSTIVCCMPGMCTPIVDNDAFVYSYDRRYDDDVGFLNFLGLGRNRYEDDLPRGRGYDDGVPTRVYSSRSPGPRRYYDGADDMPRYVTKSRGRYY